MRLRIEYLVDILSSDDDDGFQAQSDLPSFLVQQSPETLQLMLHHAGQPGPAPAATAALQDLCVQVHHLPVSLLRPPASSLHLLPQRRHTLLQPYKPRLVVQLFLGSNRKW